MSAAFTGATRIKRKYKSTIMLMFAVPMLARMYKKRLAGYAALGYSVVNELKA
jgi:hypothetical protein